MLATYPLTSGVGKSNVIFNLVFFISITSILLQGTTLPAFAKWLKLTVPVRARKSSAFEKELTLKGKSIMIQTTVESSCPCLGKSLVDLSLRGMITFTSIERSGKYFTPDGNITIEKGDRLTVLADNSVAINQLYKILGIENQ